MYVLSTKNPICFSEISKYPTSENLKELISNFLLVSRNTSFFIFEIIDETLVPISIPYILDLFKESIDMVIKVISLVSNTGEKFKNYIKFLNDNNINNNTNIIKMFKLDESYELIKELTDLSLVNWCLTLPYFSYITKNKSSDTIFKELHPNITYTDESLLMFLNVTVFNKDELIKKLSTKAMLDFIITKYNNDAVKRFSEYFKNTEYEEMFNLITSN